MKHEGKNNRVSNRNANGSGMVIRRLNIAPDFIRGKRIKSPRRFIKIKDSTACIVIHYMCFGSTGYGSFITKVIHRWNIKSVLRRAGWR